MSKTNLFLLFDKEENEFVDLHGNTENSPKFKYPAAFHQVRKANSYRKANLPKDKSVYTLKKISRREYLKKFLPDSVAFGVKNLKN